MEKLTKCSVCGGALAEVTERKRAKYRDQFVEVETRLFRCEACKEGFVTPQQMRTHAREVKNEVRRLHGLLSPERIVKIREKLGITQEALEEALGTGPKMVVRWESGKVIQSRGHDTVLRLLEREPGILKSLKQIQQLRTAEKMQYCEPNGMIALRA